MYVFRVLILIAGVKSDLFTVTNARRPWLSPGVIPTLAAMVSAIGGCSIKGWDETAQGPVPIEMMEEADLIMISGLTPSRYRIIDLVEVAHIHRKQVIVGGRDIIGWTIDEGNEAPLKVYGAICNTQMSLRLMAKILDDAKAKRLEGVYSLDEGEAPESVVPMRQVLTGKYFVRSVSSSFGCNRRCPWCTVWRDGFFTKPSEVLEQSVKDIRGKFFADTADSFAAIPEYVKEVILPIYQRSKKWWCTEITVADLLGIKSGIPLIEPMIKAGCRVLYTGVESVARNIYASKSTLKMAEDAIRQIHRAGAVVIVSLILDPVGDETIDEIEESFAWAGKHADFVQYSLSALLPGCQLRRDAIKNGVAMDPNWEHYDGAHPTNFGHQLSPETRSQLIQIGYSRFSQRGEIIKRLLRTPPKLMLPVFGGNLRYRAGAESVGV